jgi:hypothetical protein
VTGGLIVDDPEVPGLAGRYVFADVYGGQLASLVPDLINGGRIEAQAVPVSVPNPVAFTEGVGEQLYITSLAGAVYRLEPGGGR